MLHTLLKQARIEHGYSVEHVAKELAVSPETVTRWESGTELPTSQQLANLTVLYGIPLITLYAEIRNTGEAMDPRPKVEPVAHAGRIKLAIMMQTAFLVPALQSADLGSGADTMGFKLLFIYLPILLTTLWMAYNQSYETKDTQRKHNTKTELLYCLLQYGITLLGFITKHPLIATVALIVSCVYYIRTVNPNKMQRPLVAHR